MSEYTPTPERVKAAYAQIETYDAETGLRQTPEELGAELDRFIAKVKADALREAARGGDIDCASSLYLNSRADRIEGEA